MRSLLGIVLALATATAAQADGYRLLQIDGLHLKWGDSTLGRGAEVTWGVAETHVTYPDAINCGGVAPLRTLPSLVALSRPELETILEAALELWSDAGAIRFSRAAPGAAPDILIGAQAEPKGIAFANVWWDAAAAEDGIAPLTQATVCFNPDVNWSVRAGGAGIDFGYALAHEIGHAIGLDHPGPVGALMAFRSQPGVTGLMPGDRAGARLLYGAP